MCSRGFAGSNVYSDLNHLSDAVHHTRPTTLFRNDRRNRARCALHPEHEEQGPLARLALAARQPPPPGRFWGAPASAMVYRAKEVLAIWGDQWDRHHAAVTEYFADKPRANCWFSTSRPTPWTKLVSFFEGSFPARPATLGLAQPERCARRLIPSQDRCQRRRVCAFRVKCRARLLSCRKASTGSDR